ncbi:anaerobic C4-dicarboxylate transporter family protein [Nocardia sp. CDC153]|uniref:anaerobic C4-dicarboxylate transporter family protein n=1 Tax=Nocardia sp. CDC153 TaxID=3112167 RepID=UPI002DB7E807|nr:anaerobic C4-dicarboxylate transporter family protein [Nocardia sp. CDC153]MEC3955331.1 anaerobic C4-dicarboxylate transporter family protein [Nocardia sp. CDC153]
MMMAIEGAIVILAILLGVRTGGVGIGAWGLVGLLVLVFGFHVKPGNPPIDIILIVLLVVTAASVMQTVGGTDWMVRQATRVIMSRPKAVVFLAPAMSFLFTVGAGTGFIYYALLPVIYSVAYNQKLRPERPLAMAAVASQAGILASPVSAATASLAVLLEPHGFALGKILLVMWPACIAGLVVAALVETRVGKDLADDPEFQRRLAAGEITPPEPVDLISKLPAPARNSALIFLGGVLLVVAMGLISQLRPVVGGERLSVTTTIELVMGLVAVLIFLICKADPAQVPKQSIFGPGIVGAVAVLGLAWLANTFVAENHKQIEHSLGQAVSDHKWLFAVALAVVAMLTTSQSSTTQAIVPIGIALGLSPAVITGMWPACQGMYILPANGSQIATVAMDQTGSTRIGRFVLDHSFQVPNTLFILVAIAVGLPLSALVG